MRLHLVSDVENYIIDELSKCMVICENCHREVHHNKEKFKKYEKNIYEKVKTYKSYNKIDEKLIIKMRNENNTYLEISKKLGCSKSSINYILKKYDMLNKEE